MPRPEPHLAILGAGPVGLEAALYADALGLPFAVYERGEPGDYVNSWGHVRLFTPWGQNTSTLGRAALHANSPRGTLPADADVLTGREFRDAYLVPLATQQPLAGRVHPKTAVLRVGRGRSRFRLLLRGPDGKERVEEADAVLDCTGNYANPRFLGEGGIPAVGELVAREHVAWGLEDVLGAREKHYAERNVLVIGAGMSAATTVCLLAALAAKSPGTWTTWAARGPGSTPLKRPMSDPLRERDQVAGRANMLATRGEGNVEFRPSSQVESIESKGKDAGFVVHFAGDKKPVEVERVIANVGHAADDRLAGALGDSRAGYFVLGVKAAGTAFLMRQGQDQVREAFA
ncbi:MAG: FAD-dependent oxidoreductase, partial [Gemmataceae bacterium]